VQLFHYHLVTSKVRDVEARYIAKLGFQLVARYGRIGDEQTHYEAGVRGRSSTSWAFACVSPSSSAAPSTSSSNRANGTCLGSITSASPWTRMSFST